MVVGEIIKNKAQKKEEPKLKAIDVLNSQIDALKKEIAEKEKSLANLKNPEISNSNVDKDVNILNQEKSEMYVDKDGNISNSKDNDPKKRQEELSKKYDIVKYDKKNTEKNEKEKSADELFKDFAKQNKSGILNNDPEIMKKFAELNEAKQKEKESKKSATETDKSTTYSIENDSQNIKGFVGYESKNDTEINSKNYKEYRNNLAKELREKRNEFKSEYQDKIKKMQEEGIDDDLIKMQQERWMKKGNREGARDYLDKIKDTENYKKATEFSNVRREGFMDGKNKNKDHLEKSIDDSRRGKEIESVDIDDKNSQEFLSEKLQTTENISTTEEAKEAVEKVEEKKNEYKEKLKALGLSPNIFDKYNALPGWKKVAIGLGVAGGCIALSGVGLIGAGTAGIATLGLRMFNVGANYRKGYVGEKFNLKDSKLSDEEKESSAKKNGIKKAAKQFIISLFIGAGVGAVASHLGDISNAAHNMFSSHSAEVPHTEVPHTYPSDGFSSQPLTPEEAPYTEPSTPESTSEIDSDFDPEHSLVDKLKSIGIEDNVDNWDEGIRENEIWNSLHPDKVGEYIGSEEQNIELLNLLKENNISDPDSYNALIDTLKNGN